MSAFKPNECYALTTFSNIVVNHRVADLGAECIVSVHGAVKFHAVYLFLSCTIDLLFIISKLSLLAYNYSNKISVLSPV